MIEAAIASIKTGEPDLVIIFEVATKILPELPEEERNVQREQLKTVLSKQKPTQEILWAIVAFQFDDLLSETIQAIANSNTSINLNFRPSIPEAISIMRYLVCKKNWGIIKTVLEHLELFPQLDWNAADAEGLTKGLSILGILAFYQQWGLINVILNNLQWFPRLDWNAAATEGSTKGISILGILAFYQQWDLINVILNNLQWFPRLDWNAAATEGLAKGISVLYSLAEDHQWGLIKIILENPQQFPSLDWNIAAAEGEYKGASVLWFLACDQQWDLLKVLLENPQQFFPLDWNTAPIEGPVKGLSVLWNLVNNQQWDLINVILKNLQFFPLLDWNAAPTEGPVKGISLLRLLIYKKQYDLIKVILENAKKFLKLELDAAPIIEIDPAAFPIVTKQYSSTWEMLVSNKQLECIQLIAQNSQSFPEFGFKNILENEGQEFKSIILKTCLLSGRVIPSIYEDAIFYYKKKLDNTFTVVADSVLNKWDESGFKTLPEEMTENLLQPVLYAYDPELIQIPWELVIANLNLHVNKNETQLQEKAYHLTARWAVGKFFKHFVPATQTITEKHTNNLDSMAVENLSTAAPATKKIKTSETDCNVEKNTSTEMPATKKLKPNDDCERVEQAELYPVNIPAMKTNVAAWLKQANLNCFFLTHDKREQLVNEITNKPILDQAAITQSFQAVFGGNSL